MPFGGFDDVIAPDRREGNASSLTCQPNLRQSVTVSKSPSSEIKKSAYPNDTTAVLAELLERYEKNKQPILVSFRDLVPWLKVGERATHYMHSYPAKLLPQIAHFFLAARHWLPADEVVLDPFAGTGTVALEANLSGRCALYADVNPLARLITAAKTTKIDIEAASILLKAIERRFHAITETTVPWVVNIDLWYSAEAKGDLAKLRMAVEEIPLHDAAHFVWATFSVAARKCSRANPRFAVPVRVKPSRESALQRSVWSVFSEQYNANLLRQTELHRLSPGEASARCVGSDARALERLDSPTASEGIPLTDNSIGFALTSPPYAGAQKYIRASSLSLGWLGLTNAKTLKQLENASIGREHFSKASLAALPSTGIEAADEVIRAISKIDRVRAAICANYICEMNTAVIELVRVLKIGGHAVLVIGDNTVCGMTFTSSAFVARLFENHGMRIVLELIDSIKSRGLLTKRSGGATAIQTETILVFVK